VCLHGNAMTRSSSRSRHRRPQVIHTFAALTRALARGRAQRNAIALVPTMGALHAGHLALVRLALRRADRVIVSIFVNPTQFAPHEDLAAYPRTFAADLTALAALKADLVWAPSIEVMYPEGFATRIAPEGPAKAGLEDAFRPHFFAGVATVVAKLLIQCRPDIAVFGEKDYQQLKVVTRLARDLNLGTRIVGAPTVRDADGLALSSRNAYLSPAERAIAPTLHRVLADCATRIAAGCPIEAVLGDGRAAIAGAGFALDYLEARHAGTLAPVVSVKDGPLRLLLAARIGKTRLIDNVAVSRPRSRSAMKPKV
jgi:pantoate--beta-alanine ligase